MCACVCVCVCVCANSRHSFRPFLCRFFLFEFMYKSLHFFLFLATNIEKEEEEEEWRGWLPRVTSGAVLLAGCVIFVLVVAIVKSLSLLLLPLLPRVIAPVHTTKRFESLLPPRRTHPPPSDTTKQRTSEDYSQKETSKLRTKYSAFRYQKMTGECLRMIP